MLGWEEEPSGNVSAVTAAWIEFVTKAAFLRAERVLRGKPGVVVQEDVWTFYIRHAIHGSEVGQLEKRMAQSADALLKVLEAPDVRAALKPSK